MNDALKHGVLGAVIALVSGAVFIGLTHPATPQGNLAGVRTISVSGHANKKLLPDEAHLRVNLNAMKLKLADAKADHDEKLRALLDIVKNDGVEERKIRTESSTVQPIYEYVNETATAIVPYPQPKRVFKGYRVQTQLDITVLDTTKVGALMEKITDAGFEKDANTEWGSLLDLNYQVSEPDKKRDALLSEAIAAARSKAEMMAKAAGTSVARVQSINEGNVSNYNPRPVAALSMAKAGAMAGSAASVTPPSGEQELEANVSVVFELN